MECPICDSFDVTIEVKDKEIDYTPVRATNITYHLKYVMRYRRCNHCGLEYSEGVDMNANAQASRDALKAVGLDPENEIEHPGYTTVPTEPLRWKSFDTPPPEATYLIWRDKETAELGTGYYMSEDHADWLGNEWLSAAELNALESSK